MLKTTHRFSSQVHSARVFQSFSYVISFFLEPCNSPIGIENGLINDLQMVSMNIYDNDPELYGAHLGRLHSKTGYRANQPSTAWITVDFGRPIVLTEISTQGYGDPRVSEWVTVFKLFYAFESNNTDFKPLRDSTGQEMVRFFIYLFVLLFLLLLFLPFLVFLLNCLCLFVSFF